MAVLEWIDDKSLFEAVNFLLLRAAEAKRVASSQFGKNGIDPFSALFEISGFGMDYPTWYKSETARQAQKTLQNHIGDFHQKILGSCKGWDNQNTGKVIDLISSENQIIAEIKNKHNTISGGSLSNLYKTLQAQVMPKASKYKNYVAYYVIILPKTPRRFDITFTPSDKETGKKCEMNESIRQIDGASFYEKVTGHKNALEDLFDTLPLVIADVSKNESFIDDMQFVKPYFKLAYG